MLQVRGFLPWVYLYLYLFCGQTPLSQRLSVCSSSIRLTLKREECWEGTRGLWATWRCPDIEGEEVQDCCSLGWQSLEMWWWEAIMPPEAGQSLWCPRRVFQHHVKLCYKQRIPRKYLVWGTEDLQQQSSIKINTHPQKNRLWRMIKPEVGWKRGSAQRDLSTQNF